MPQALIGGALSAVGGIVQSNGAKSAARSQEAAARDQIALARETRDLTRADLAPYVESGSAGQQAYLSTLGLGDAPQVNGQAWGGYEQSPGYQFQLQQGMDALQSTAAAGGGLNSGRTMRDALTYGQGLAAQDFGNFQNRLAALGQSGQSAAAMQGDANANYAQMGTNALGSIGNAQAAGKIGSANAYSDMMGNLVGAWGQQSAKPSTGSFNIGGKLFGGNSWG